MEDKQLNFNQPFLSVRRYSPTVTSQKDDKRKTNNSLVPQLPYYRSGLKSGPVRNPGAVPFIWEQTPGQPKEEIKPKTQNCNRPPIAPKLPPGRYPQANMQDSRNIALISSEDRKQTGNAACNLQSSQSLYENIKKIERCKDTTEKASSDSGDSDEGYVDALDTLSKTESFFINCSVSGLSELDDLDLKPSGTFLTDPQTREFMMDRFLPEAKAVASEIPQYVSKKEPVVREQPQQLKKIVNQNKPTLRYGPSFAKRYSYCHNTDEEESDDDYDQHEKLPAVCGLLPRFCLKSSLCRLNPVPAMSVRTRVPKSPSNTMKPRSSLAGSYSETDNESKSDISELKLVDKIQTVDLDVNKTSLRSERDQLVYRNTSTCCDAPLSFLEEQEVLGIPEETKHSVINGFGLHTKGCKSFEELLADQGCQEELDCGGPDVVEKTLYVGTVKKVEFQNISNCSPTTQDTNGVSSREEDHDKITKRMDQMHLIDLSLEEIKKLDIVDESVKLLPDAHKYVNFNIVSTLENLNPKWGMAMPKAFGENQDVKPDSTTTKNIEVTNKVATEGLQNQPPIPFTLQNSHQNYSKFPVPPSLPKSPSDSWLWRTLPSMSAKNLSLRGSYLGAATNRQNHGSKTPTGDINWQSIVKTTKAQHQHSRYSEEPLTPIPET